MSITERAIQRVPIRHVWSLSFYMKWGVVALVIALLVLGFIRTIRGLLPLQPADFSAYYAAAALLNEGDFQDLYDPEAQDRIISQRSQVMQSHSYIYLPFLAVVLRPLALLSFEEASAVWLGVNIFLLLIGTLFLLKLAGSPVTPRMIVAAFLFCLIYPPITLSLVLGQVNVALLLLLASAIYLLDASPSRRRLEVLAGVLIGVATAIKLYPILFSFSYLLRRRWWPLVGNFIGLLMALIVGIVGSGGPSNTVRFFVEVVPRLPAPYSVANQSLFGALQRLLNSPTNYEFSVFEADNAVVLQLTPLINSPSLVRPLWLVLSLAVLVITLLGTYQIIQKGGPIRLDLSLILALILIVLPRVHEHYLSLLIIPFAVALSFRRQQTNPWRWIVLVMMLLLVHRYWKPLAFAGIPIRYLSLGLAGTLVTWLSLLSSTLSSLVDKHRKAG